MDIRELEIKYNCTIEEEEMYGEIFYIACIEDDGVSRFCYASGYNLEDLEVSMVNAIADMNECDLNN